MLARYGWAWAGGGVPGGDMGDSGDCCSEDAGAVVEPVVALGDWSLARVGDGEAAGVAYVVGVDCFEYEFRGAAVHECRADGYTYRGGPGFLPCGAGRCAYGRSVIEADVVWPCTREVVPEYENAGDD